MHLFSRNVQVRIESVDGQAKMFKSEDGFTIEFECGFGTRATSKVKLWNVLNSAVEMCNSKNNKRAKLELYAGYEEEIYLLTSAYILSHDVKKSGADRVLEIQVGA